MRRQQLLWSRYALVGAAFFAWVAACSKPAHNLKPNAGNSNAGNSNAGNPNAGNPNAGNPNAGNPSAGNSNAGSSNGGNSNGGNSNAGNPNAGNPNAGNSNAGHPCDPNAPTSNYVLIDDMETTDHGPIEFVTGIDAPLTPGYWYNSGASYTGDDGGVADTSNPPQMSFVFTALPSPTTTLACTKSSAHAAHQSCSLSGLYDTCGLGFEFAQQPDPDAGAPTDMGDGGPSTDDAGDGGPSMGDAGDGGPSDAGDGGPSMDDAGDAGDGGPPIPKITVPFDISRYKAVTFWGMTTTPDPAAGTLQVKVSFPDTDTDPRGEICNGGGGNTSKCYNSYAATFGFTASWQQFTVNLDTGDAGVPAGGGIGIAIDPSWGYQGAQWIPTQVYGINWQAQRNTDPTAGPPLMTDIWIDDVYFIQ
jgi:hypothetical protein